MAGRGAVVEECKMARIAKAEPRCRAQDTQKIKASSAGAAPHRTHSLRR